MSKVCEIVDEVTLACLEWVDFSYLPTLTGEDRDMILQWTIGIFAVVFVVKKLSRFFS